MARYIQKDKNVENDQNGQDGARKEMKGCGEKEAVKLKLAVITLVAFHIKGKGADGRTSNKDKGKDFRIINSLLGSPPILQPQKES